MDLAVELALELALNQFFFCRTRDLALGLAMDVYMELAQLPDLELVLYL